MRLFVVLALGVVLVQAKISIEKLDIQYDKQHVEVKYEVKDKKFVSVDVHALGDAADVILHVEVYSKIDGNFNPLLKLEPIHICKIHEHEEPLVKFIHDEVLMYGNITKACPVHKGDYYYMHDFTIDSTKLPLALPPGEIRLDINATVFEGGQTIHLGSSETYLKLEP